MGLLSWIIVGLLTGWLAGMAVKGGPQYGVLGSIILGIIGAVVCSFLFSALFIDADTMNTVRWDTLIVSFLGATSIVAYVELFEARR